MLKNLSIFALFMCSLALAENRAEAATTDLKQLQSLLASLGVEATMTADAVTVSGQGKFNTDIVFNLSEDKTTVGVAASFEAIAADKRSIAPYADLLKINTAGEGFAQFAFGLCSNKDVEWICVGGVLDAAELNAKFLRGALDGLIAEIDDNEPLWNSAKWTAAPAAPVSVEAARAVVDAAWDASPLEIGNANFVSAKPKAYGSFDKRSTNAFKAGEEMLVYAEPKNYAWKNEGAAGYSFGFTFDVAVLNEKGETIYEKLKSMETGVGASRYRLRESDVDLSFELTGVPAGNYTLRYTVHDQNGPKSAVIALPFKIEG